MEISLLNNWPLGLRKHYAGAKPFVTGAAHGNIVIHTQVPACNESMSADE